MVSFARSLGWAAVALVSCMATQSDASLALPPPLLRIHHPRSPPSIQILPKAPSPRSPASNLPFVSDRTLRRRLDAVGKRAPASLAHDDTFRTVIEVDGEEFALHMKPNVHLLHPSFATLHPTTHPLHPSNVLAYEGHVFPLSHSAARLREDLAGGIIRTTAEEIAAGSLGWARLLVHSAADGLYEGAFTVRGETYTVLKSETYARVKEAGDPLVETGRQDGLVVFRDRDVREANGDIHSCSHDALDFNMHSEDPVHRQKAIEAEMRANPWWAINGGLGEMKLGREEWSLERRDDVPGGSTGGNFTATIGQSAGCPTSHKLLYMGVAADCAYVQQYGGEDAARTAILNTWNTASALYKETFNVSLGIVELFVQSATCPTTVDQSVAWNTGCDTLTLNDRLSAFSKWRGAQRANDQAGLWALMSGCPTGQEVGVAWLGQLCVNQARDQGSQGTVSGTSVATKSRTEWQVVAHEIGHNFGAVHDCTSDTCGSNCCPLTSTTCDAAGSFLMSPTSQAGEQKFSPCTLGNICSAIGTRAVDSSCLAEPGSVTLISLRQCGNGIVEPGEDCDPGANGSDTCCDRTTCKFKTGAVCDPASSTCCTDTCSFAPATTVCRPSLGACDIAETCTGTNSTCPADVTQPDGQSCGADGLACASGLCTSKDLQCRTVGASLGITRACTSSNGNSCAITCQSPGSASGNQCVILQSTFADGTPCGFGGRCSDGNCNAGSALNTAKSWYRQNLNIAIPVTIVVGVIVLLILIAILRCVIRCCSRDKGSNRRGHVAPPPMMAQMYSSGNNRESQQSNNSNTPLNAGSGPTYSYGQNFPPPPSRNMPPPPPTSHQQRGNWVDPSAYNGQNSHEPRWR